MHFFSKTDFNIILHLCLRLPNSLSSFQLCLIHFLYAFVVSPARDTHPAHHTLLDFINLMICDDKHSCWHSWFSHPPVTSSTPTAPSSEPLRWWQVPQLSQQVTVIPSSLICKEMRYHSTSPCIHLSCSYLKQNFAFRVSTSSCIQVVLT